MVHSESRPLVRLVACITSALDSGSSIFVGSFSKNLALVAVGPWFGRRYGNIITSVIATDRHPRWLAWRRRVHRGRSTPGPSTAGMWWFDGAPARRPRQSRIIFIGDSDEAPDGGSPLVELLRSRREVEEQLRARQSFCWRGWWRQLRGPWRASTSNHVRRSSITAQRLRAIFASTSAGMLDSFVP